MSVPRGDGDVFWPQVNRAVCLLEGLDIHKHEANLSNVHLELSPLNALISKDNFRCFDCLFTRGHPEYTINFNSLSRLSKGICKYASVPTFQGREDCGFTSSDFVSVIERSERAIELYSNILEKLSQSIKRVGEEACPKRPLFCQNLSVFILLFIGQHSQHDLWTNKKVVEACEKLSLQVASTMRCNSLSELMYNPCDNALVSPGISQQILSEIKPKFQKDNWKQNPGVPRIFTWMMSHLKSPHVSNQLHLVLPPSLLLVDDHQPEHKVLGIQSLHMVLKECSHEEIRWHKRSDVIFEALKHQLYLNEADVLEAVLPAMILILEIIEKVPRSASPPKPENRYDFVLSRILQSMEMENILILRRIYARHVPQLMTNMGITLCRHIPRLLRVITCYLEVYDGPTEVARDGALNMLEVLIKATWPRLHHHTDAILKSLLKLVYDVSTERTATPARVNEGLIAKATTCGKYLLLTNPEKIKASLSAIANSDVNEACAVFARCVIIDPL